MQRMKTLLTVAFLGASLTAGCNVSTTGAEGNVAFTPEECGRSGCDFADGIGVGGVLNVQIGGLDGFSTVGINLESSNPETLQVAIVGDVGGEPTWSLTGLGIGPSRLMAVDLDGIVADYIDVDVVQPDGLTLVPLGEAVGPTFDNPDFDEVWSINNNQQVIFQVTPVVGIDAATTTPVMGRYEYGHVIDGAMLEMVENEDQLVDGRLYFTPTADGPYVVTFSDNYGNSLTALIEVAATP